TSHISPFPASFCVLGWLSPGTPTSGRHRCLLACLLSSTPFLVRTIATESKQSKPSLDFSPCPYPSEPGPTLDIPPPICSIRWSLSVPPPVAHGSSPIAPPAARERPPLDGDGPLRRRQVPPSEA